MAEKGQHIGFLKVHGEIKVSTVNTRGEAVENMSGDLEVAHRSFPYAPLEAIVFEVTQGEPLILTEVERISQLPDPPRE